MNQFRTRDRGRSRLEGLEARQLLADVTSFSLINADTNGTIQKLPAGTTLNLATLASRHLNVRANLSGGIAKHESVRFTLDGKTRTDNTAPFSLFGNDGPDFFAGDLPVGTHTLTATAFDGAKATGKHGKTYSVTFTVTDQTTKKVPAVTQFDLIDASTDKVLTTLAPGGTIDLSTLPAGHELNVRADLSGTGMARSVVFKLDGALSLSHVENGSPYALFSNNLTDYFGGTFPVGTYTLTAQAYASASGKGDSGTALGIHFKVANNAPSAAVISGLSLIDSKDDSSLGALTNQEVIDGNTVDLTQLNILATTSSAQVGSVKFVLDGDTHIENAAPYAIFSDFAGDLLPGEIKPGTHTLQVTAYSKADAKGTAGPAKSLVFVVNAADATNDPLAVSPISLRYTSSNTGTATFINLADDAYGGYNGYVYGGSAVQSVGFQLDGGPVRVDNGSDDGSQPYRLFPFGTDGQPTGSFQVGTHTLTARGYAQDDAKGDAGPVRTLTFTVINDPTAPDVSLALRDTTSGAGYVDYDNPVFVADTASGTSRVAIYTHSRVTGQDRVPGSVVYTLDGKVVKVDNASPFSLFGTDADSVPVGGPLALGTHTLTVTPYAGPDGTGQVGPGDSTTFTVEALPTTSDVLVFNHGDPDPDYPDFKAPSFARSFLTFYNPTKKGIALDGSIDLQTEYVQYDPSDPSKGTTGDIYLTPADEDYPGDPLFNGAPVVTLAGDKYALVRTANGPKGDFTYTFKSVDGGGNATDQPYVLPAGETLSLSTAITTFFSVKGSGSPTKKGHKRPVSGRG